MNFQWPYLVLLLPIPMILKYLSRKKRRSAQNTSGGLVLPFYHELIESYQNEERPSTSFNLRNLLKILSWIFIVIALMRPISLGEPISLPLPTHDIIMALDISGSMRAEDMSESYRQSRLDVVKRIAHKFIEQRESDRLGLVFFGSHSFLSSPLTLDKKSLHTFLDKTQIGFAGERTAIGDAVGLAVKRLKLGNDSKNTKFIILLSDGSNTSGEVDPLEAADIAAKYNIKIYTIGIGKISNNIFDLQSGMSLDEETLQQIASKTDGVYFHASNMRALENIYNQINKLEPVQDEHKIIRPESELYIYPLLTALLFLTLFNITYRRNGQFI